MKELVAKNRAAPSNRLCHENLTDTAADIREMYQRRINCEVNPSSYILRAYIIYTFISVFCKLTTCKDSDYLEVR